MPAPWHYLDHAASSPLRPEARAAMAAALDAGYGNPSGAHALGRAGRAALDDARAELAELVGAAPGEIVFTSGGTEADNLAVRGVLAARGGTAVCTAIEHKAVLEPVRASGGRVVPVDQRGLVDLDALAAQLDDTVTLVSVGLVNNEIGTVQPLDDDRGRGAATAHPRRCPAHGRRPGAHLARPRARPPRPPTSSRWRRTSAAARSASARWWCAPGWPSPRSRSAGGRSASGAAARRTSPARRPSPPPRRPPIDSARRWSSGPRAWRDALVTATAAAIPGTRESAVPAGSTRDHLVAGIANVCLPAVNSEALLFVLEHDHRVLASAASSCASGAQEPSHVLAALGIDRALAAAPCACRWAGRPPRPTSTSPSTPCPPRPPACRPTPGTGHPA